VRELRFHRDLYAAAAIDAAVAQLVRFAAIERSDDPPYSVVTVRVEGDDAARERAVAGTLANIALARTVESGGPHR
jgi:hypothetical protein